MSPKQTLATAMATISAFGAHCAELDWPIQIDLQPEIVARGDSVLLGEVGVIRTRDREAIRRLVMLPLGQAPRHGSEAIVSRETIARWVRAKLGIRPQQVQWTGAMQVAVRTQMPSRKTEAEVARANALTPVVMRGDWVALRMKAGDIELQSGAEVLQDGDIGQVIRVRTTNGTAPVSARVLSRGQVEALL